jgi:hypothetical protein
VDLVDYFNEDPPLIWFADGSSLEGNNYVELREGRPPYDSSKIEAWDWRDVNIRKESQGDEKAADSIQGRVIRELKRREYDVIVDDDRSGEAADIVAIRLMKVGDSPAIIEVEFYHCKFSSASAPGARIGDLYEVCGQAQKSVRWTSSGVKRADLFTHLLRRAGREIERRDRYELGDSHKLQTIRDMSHACEMKMRIFVVQPGLSKAAVSLSQLELLSVTETYLFETYQLAFGVIASP